MGELAVDIYPDTSDAAVERGAKRSRSRPKKKNRLRLSRRMKEKKKRAAEDGSQSRQAEKPAAVPPAPPPLPKASPCLLKAPSSDALLVELRHRSGFGLFDAEPIVRFDMSMHASCQRPALSSQAQKASHRKSLPVHLVTEELQQTLRSIPLRSTRAPVEPGSKAARGARPKIPPRPPSTFLKRGHRVQRTQLDVKPAEPGGDANKGRAVGQHLVS